MHKRSRGTADIKNSNRIWPVIKV